MNFLFKNYIHFTPKEAVKLLDLRNAPFVRRHMYHPGEIEPCEHLNWIQALKNRKDVCYWVIYLDKHLIGSIDLTRIDASKRFAEWGFFIDEHHLGLGAVIEFLGMEYFIKTLGFKTLLACVFEENVQVYHLHMVKFGYETAHAYDTEYCGKTFYGLTLSDKNWERNRLKIKTLLGKLYRLHSVIWEEISA